MPTSTPVPGRMIRTLPENGYESPQSPENDEILFAHGIHRDGKRRRNPFMGSSEEIPPEVGEGNAGSQAYQNETGRVDQEKQDEEGEPKRVGFRDRISCFTWTWFTMTMATGGIANVLHSSNADHIPLRGV